MVEYAAVVSRNFGETFLNIWQDTTNFLGGVPFYWYVIVPIALFLLCRSLAGR